MRQSTPPPKPFATSTSTLFQHGTHPRFNPARREAKAHHPLSRPHCTRAPPRFAPLCTFCSRRLDFNNPERSFVSDISADVARTNCPVCYFGLRSAELVLGGDAVERGRFLYWPEEAQYKILLPEEGCVTLQMFHVLGESSDITASGAHDSEEVLMALGRRARRDDPHDGARRDPVQDAPARVHRF